MGEHIVYMLQFSITIEKVAHHSLTASTAPCQVLASFLVQDLESGGLNPFLLTYIANSLFIIYLPIQYMCHRLGGHKHTRRCAGPHAPRMPACIARLHAKYAPCMQPCRPSDDAEVGTLNGGAVQEPLADDEEGADLMTGPPSSALQQQRREPLPGLDMQILQAAAVVSKLLLS